MGSFSLWHWLIVIVVVMLLFGGRGKVSDLMGDFGKGINSFKKGLAESKDEPRTIGAEREKSAITSSIEAGSILVRSRMPLNTSANTLSVHHCLIAHYVMRGPQFDGEFGRPRLRFAHTLGEHPRLRFRDERHDHRPLGQLGDDSY